MSINHIEISLFFKNNKKENIAPAAVSVVSAVCACVPAGPVNLSTNAQLVAPAAVLKGTLSVTASELYFEVDEDDPGFKAIDPKVRDSGSIDPASNCHR